MRLSWFIFTTTLRGRQCWRRHFSGVNRGSGGRGVCAHGRVGVQPHAAPRGDRGRADARGRGPGLRGRPAPRGSVWRAPVPSSGAASPAPPRGERRPSSEARPATTYGWLHSDATTILCDNLHFVSKQNNGSGPFLFPGPGRRARSSGPRSPARGPLPPTLCGTKSLAPSVPGCPARGSVVSVSFLCLTVNDADETATQRFVAGGRERPTLPLGSRMPLWEEPSG